VSRLNGDYENDADMPEGPTHTHKACVILHTHGRKSKIIFMPRSDDDNPMWDDIVAYPERQTQKVCVDLHTHGKYLN
jgi:hypothetical protein